MCISETPLWLMLRRMSWEVRHWRLRPNRRIIEMGNFEKKLGSTIHSI